MDGILELMKSEVVYNAKKWIKISVKRKHQNKKRKQTKDEWFNQK